MIIVLIRRHDLVFVRPAGWRALLETRSDLAADPLVALWVDKGRPLIGRRAAPGEGRWRGSWPAAATICRQRTAFIRYAGGRHCLGRPTPRLKFHQGVWRRAHGGRTLEALRRTCLTALPWR